MNNKEKFNNASKKISEKITYADVAQMFNELNKKLHGEHYESRPNMVDTDGAWVPGFVYTGYQAGMGLREILNKLGIRHSTLILSGSGIDEESEIHIEPEYASRMSDILEKLGTLQSSTMHEFRTDVARNKLMEQIR